MNELIGGFLAGNAAILTNACLLPLYPGLIAFLAGPDSGFITGASLTVDGGFEAATPLAAEDYRKLYIKD